MLISMSYSQVETKAVHLGKDECDYCGMTIRQAPFVAQLKPVSKGHALNFDDLACMIHYIRENPQPEGTEYYVADYCQPDHFLDVRKAMFISSSGLRSPMAGNIAAFSNSDSLMVYQSRYQAEKVTWTSLLK